MSIFTEYVLNLTEDHTYEQIRNLHDNKQTHCETNTLLGYQDSVDKTLYPKVVTKSLCIRRLIGTMKLNKISVPGSKNYLNIIATLIKFLQKNTELKASLRHF